MERERPEEEEEDDAGAVTVTVTGAELSDRGDSYGDWLFDCDCVWSTEEQEISEEETEDEDRADIQQSERE